MTRSAEPLTILDLGRMAYEPALAEQRRIHRQVLNEERPSTMLLVEHDPVVTITRRQGAAENLLASPEQLARQGVTVCPTDRGGDITYHGPGQIVAYPILRLNDYQLNLRSYVRLLERSIIDTLAHFGITGRMDCSAPGVWVVSAPLPQVGERLGEGDDPKETSDQPPATSHELAKIAAIGVRVTRWVSMHGLALNVDPDLSHFQLIVPCGLVGRPVTSMAQQLGEACPPIPAVRDQLTRCLQDHLAHG